MRHSEGPWKLNDKTDLLNIDIEAADGRSILNSLLEDYTDETDLANARLIAAAPCLFDALEALIKVYKDTIGDGPIEALSTAKQAIKNARGESK